MNTLNLNNVNLNDVEFLLGTIFKTYTYREIKKLTGISIARLSRIKRNNYENIYLFEVKKITSLPLEKNVNK